MRPRRLVPFALLGAALASGCTDEGGTSASTTSLPTTTTTQPPRPDDGILRLGILFPVTGDAASLGQPMVDAAERAVREINAAGGVNGQQVEVVAVDEGTTAASATDAITSLVDAGVDAVIGPASSAIALATLRHLVDEGILTCSPTASALALDDYPGRELFVRTVPSDSLQAEAIAQVASQTGARSAAVSFLDDAYGRPFARATVDGLEARGLDVVAQVPFAADDETLVDDAVELSETGPDVVVVIADADSGTRMLAAIGEDAELIGSESPPDVIVNDAMRRPPAQIVQALPPALLENLQGVSPRALPQSDDEPPGAYATNAYDCVNLIALGAVQAESDNPTLIGRELPSVSEGGSPCRDYASCAGLIATRRRINYDGPSGLLQVGLDGDPNVARFDVFTFDAAGADVASGAPIVIAS